MRMRIALFEKRPILKGSRGRGVSILPPTLSYSIKSHRREQALSQEGKGGPYERCRHHYSHPSIQ